jgi:hypothetical protein
VGIEVEIFLGLVDRIRPSALHIERETTARPTRGACSEANRKPAAIIRMGGQHGTICSSASGCLTEEFNACAHFEKGELGRPRKYASSFLSLDLRVERSIGAVALEESRDAAGR